jgi:hypothetical protein
MSCGPQVRELLSGWSAKFEEAIPETPAPPGTPIATWLIPTKKIGTWVRLSNPPFNSQAVAQKVSPAHILEVSFQGDGNCSSQLKVKARTDRKITSGSFRDEDLESLIQSGKAGVFYSWSPHMPLSLDGLEQVASAAKQLGVELVVLQDPIADPKGIEAALPIIKKLKLQSRVLAAQELAFRGFTTHYPNVMVFGKGQLVSRMFPGLTTRNGYLKFVRENLP